MRLPSHDGVGSLRVQVVVNGRGRRVGAEWAWRGRHAERLQGPGGQHRRPRFKLLHRGLRWLPRRLQRDRRVGRRHVVSFLLNLLRIGTDFAAVLCVALHFRVDTDGDEHESEEKHHDASDEHPDDSILDILVVSGIICRTREALRLSVQPHCLPTSKTKSLTQ